MTFLLQRSFCSSFVLQTLHVNVVGLLVLFFLLMVVVVVVDAVPPDATIISPAEGTTFHVGQIFHLRGQAVDPTTGQDIDSSYLRWEVEYHYYEEHSNDNDNNYNDKDQGDKQAQTKVFMKSRVGNNIVMRPAPRPHVPFFVGGGVVDEDDSSSSSSSSSSSPSSSSSSPSFLRIILHATDPSTGDVSVTERIVFPSIATVDIRTVPPGLDVVVNEYLLHELHTGTATIINNNDVNVDNKEEEQEDDVQLELQTWKGSEIVVQTGNQRPYIFSSWSDGSTDRKRTIKLTEDYQEIVALFCLYGEEAACQTDADCCSGRCSSSSGTCLPSPNTDPSRSSSDGDSEDGMSNSATITLSVLFGLALVVIIAILGVLQRRRNYLRHGCGFKTDDSGDDTSSNNDSHSSNKNKDNNSSDGETDDASQEKKKQKFQTRSEEDVVNNDVEAPSGPQIQPREVAKSTTKIGIMSTMRSILHTTISSSSGRKVVSSTKNNDDHDGNSIPSSDAKDIIVTKTHDAECHISENKQGVATLGSDDDKQSSEVSKTSKPDRGIKSSREGGRIGTTISVESRTKARPVPPSITGAAILDMAGTILSSSSSSSSSRPKEGNVEDNDVTNRNKNSNDRSTTTSRRNVVSPPKFMFTELE